MIRKYFILFFVFVFGTSEAQVTFSEHIAPIIYNKCTSCHRAGEVGPMPLTNYSEISNYSKMIKTVIESKQMPPWMPNTTYSHFLNERTISDNEIKQINDWIANGMPEGNKVAEPELPNFPIGSQLGKPDLVVSMKQSYLHKGNNKDEYRVFVLPTHLTETKEIKGIEVRPGNPSIIHHLVLALDTTKYANELDKRSIGYGYSNLLFGFSPTYDYWGGWLPGSQYRFFPEGMGTFILPNSEILLRIHYVPTPLNEKDSTVINIFYADKPLSRFYQLKVLGTENIKKGLFFIPADSIKTFYGEYKVEQDISLVRIAPHNHFLGKKWEVFVINSIGDTIKLIKIDDWSFYQQDIFNFQKLIKIEKGCTIYYNATYDNTIKNKANPNNPPKSTAWGETTKDEMFLCYLISVPYQKGDENIELSGIINSFNVSCISEKVIVDFNLADNVRVNLNIYDNEGKIVKEVINNQNYVFGKHQSSIDAKDFKKGIYWCKITTSYFSDSKKIVIE